MKTKIKLVNADASFLQDTSQLDVSKDASYMIGDIFQQNQSQTPSTTNIFGAQVTSASPSSSPPAANRNVPQTPALGGGSGNVINFFPMDDEDEDVDNNEQQNNNNNNNASLLDMNQNLDNSLMGLGGNMMQGTVAMQDQQDNMNKSLLGLENDGRAMQIDTSIVDANDLNLSNIDGNTGNA